MIRCLEDGPDIGGHRLPHGLAGHIVASVLLQMELAALPWHRRENSRTGSFEATVVIRSAQHFPPAIGIHTHGQQYRTVDDRAAMAHFFVTAIQHYKRISPQWALAPGCELVIEQSGTARDFG